MRNVFPSDLSSRAKTHLNVNTAPGRLEQQKLSHIVCICLSACVREVMCGCLQSCERMRRYYVCIMDQYCTGFFVTGNHMYNILQSLLSHHYCFVMNTNQNIETQLDSTSSLNYCLQLEQLGSELTADRESLLSAESLSTDLMKEKALLEKTLETLRENSERQVHTNTHAYRFNLGSLYQNQMATYFFAIRRKYVGVFNY